MSYRGFFHKWIKRWQEISNPIPNYNMEDVKSYKDQDLISLQMPENSKIHYALISLKYKGPDPAVSHNFCPIESNLIGHDYFFVFDSIKYQMQTF